MFRFSFLHTVVIYIAIFLELDAFCFIALILVVSLWLYILFVVIYGDVFTWILNRFMSVSSSVHPVSIEVFVCIYHEMNYAHIFILDPHFQNSIYQSILENVKY